jgi:hypothetical protein
MKNEMRFAINLAGAVLCALPNVAMAQSGAGDSQGGQAASIEGTWICKVQPIGAPQGFIALGSFTAGGVALATGTSDRMPPFAPAPTAPISILMGSWKRLDNNTYVTTINFFIFDTLGNATNMFQNNVTYRLTDNNDAPLVGTGVGSMCDPDGSNCKVSSSITLTCKRLIAQGAFN